MQDHMRHQEIADSAALLATCKRCRNALAYLMWPPMSEEELRHIAAARFRALPLRHRNHTPDTDTDTQTPRGE